MNRVWAHNGLGVLAAAALLVACDRTPAGQLTCEQRPAASAAGDSIAITNVTVIDVAGGAHQTGVTVLTRGQDIVEIGRDVSVPAGAVRVDATGKFLIPGLWDMHAHHQGTGAESVDLFVANGVVGTRDMGADADFILPLRDRINRGELLGPEIVATGPILDDRPSHWPFRRRVRNAEEARAAVRDLVGRKRRLESDAAYDVWWSIPGKPALESPRRRGRLRFDCGRESPIFTWSMWLIGASGRSGTSGQFKSAPPGLAMDVGSTSARAALDQCRSGRSPRAAGNRRKSAGMEASKHSNPVTGGTCIT